MTGEIVFGATGPGPTWSWRGITFTGNRDVFCYGCDPEIAWIEPQEWAERWPHLEPTEQNAVDVLCDAASRYDDDLRYEIQRGIDQWMADYREEFFDEP